MEKKFGSASIMCCLDGELSPATTWRDVATGKIKAICRKCGSTHPMEVTDSGIIQMATLRSGLRKPLGPARSRYVKAHKPIDFI